MGNRSRYIAVSAATIAAAALAARRHARLRDAAAGIGGAILPSRWVAGTAAGADDEAHAAGHRHLHPEAQPPLPDDSAPAEHQRAGHGHQYAS